MINVSSEFKTLIRGNDRKFYGGAEITLADATVLTLDNTKIIDLKIEDATSQSGKFTLGSAIINKLTLTIDNLTEEFSDYDFTGAVIRPTVGLKLSETTETLNKGVFTADDPKAIGSIITLTALDNMLKFDTPFKDVVLVFPTTPILLLSAVCLHCGVTLATTTFLNDDFVITERPLDDAVSCREVVSWIAQLSGNFARMNTSGQLELKWYDFEIFEEGNLDGGTFDDTEETSYQSGDSAYGGNFTDYTSGDNIDGGSFTDLSRFHHFYSLSQFSVATDDVVITGISVTDSAETPNTVLYGQVGYVISLEGNKLIQSLEDATTIANSVGAAIIGMKFRPCSISVLSDPSVEGGDVAYVSDRKGNVYQILVTNLTYAIGKSMPIKCDAESPSRNSSVRYTAETKTIVEARKYTQVKITAYDLMVRQLNDLISHSFGFYSSEEVLPDGSKIYYKHDKPTLAESMKIWKETIDAFAISTDGGETYTAGFDAEGNAVFNILSAIGINADWIRLGKLLSTDGATLIDMEYGVANSDNISFVDNVANTFPLKMPFNIDDSVSQINKVLLKYTVDKFRTYSTTASSGGDSTQTSEGGGGDTGTTNPSSTGFDTDIATQLITIYGTSLSTNSGGSHSGDTGLANPPAGTPHYHSFGVPDHTHNINSHDHGVLTSGHWHSASYPHSHGVEFPNHTHNVSIPSHTHNLNFGIMETPITNYAIDIYIDGTLRVSIANDIANIQGIVDLTEWVTTVGWHTIELRSTTLKRISAQINIKSYIRS